EIASLQKDQRPFRSLKGKLTWPAAGRIQRLFGRKRGSSKVTWNGIMIRARQGNNVHAVSHGR
ncbi:MAG: ATPase, partial [Anaerolineae bacterium]|nr:ATPase [Anaerolineae bacterium]